PAGRTSARRSAARCRRPDVLSLRRLAPRHHLAVGPVVAELRRQARGLAEARAVLQLVVDVRLGGVAAVAALPELLSGRDAVAGLDLQRALAEIDRKST